jgi:hypothetical protein
VQRLRGRLEGRLERSRGMENSGGIIGFVHRVSAGLNQIAQKAAFVL